MRGDGPTLSQYTFTVKRLIKHSENYTDQMEQSAKTEAELWIILKEFPATLHSTCVVNAI